MHVHVPNAFYVAQQAQVTIRDAENRNNSCISRQRPSPPMGLINAMADFKLTGGFDVSVDNICEDHNEVRSRSGECAGCLLGPGNGSREPLPTMRTPGSRIARRAKQNGLT